MHTLTEFPRCDLPERLPLVPRHHNIGIIVPGNKTAVANRTEQGTGVQRIGNPVLLTDSVYLF